MYNSSIKINVIIPDNKSTYFFILPCEYAQELQKSTRLLLNMLRAEIPYVNDHAIKGCTNISDTWCDKRDGYLALNISVKNNHFGTICFSEYDNVNPLET